MGHSEGLQGRSIGKPDDYRIVVQGILPESYSDRLGGLCIVHEEIGNQRPVTILVGPIRDQAELSGVLNTLYELHRPILEVLRLPPTD